ncbi:hypothetical protein Bca4012_010401 [Brassica carinata]
MSKRSGSSVPLTAERLGSRRRMDSPVSKLGSSSDPHDESGHKSLAPALLSFASQIPPLVGPTSSVGEKDLEDWRKSYSVPSSVVLRIPDPSERASNGTPEEIAIYEAFFKSGFRGDVPSLIADLCSFFRISPSQLNPPAWRILISILSLSDEEDLPLGVDEVLFAYHLAPINGGEGRFHLRSRNGFLSYRSFLRATAKDWLLRGPILLVLRARATLLELERFLSSVVRWLI